MGLTTKQHSKKEIRIALPKKGRLRQPVLKLLTRAGYHFHHQDHLLMASCAEAGIDFYYLRTEDIPTLVEEGAVDLGITGKDQVEEKGSKLTEILPLNIGTCHLSLAGPDHPPPALKELEHKKIATSFPCLTQNFFKDHGLKIRTVPISGSLEIMPSLGLCDAIVDIVQTGRTLEENQLHVYTNIGTYYTALYAHKEILADKRVHLLQKRLLGALHAQKYRILEYNIAKDLLKKAEKITPGFDSPTISSLEDTDKVAVKVLVKREEIVSAMDALEYLGATGILETEIKNCRL